MQRGLDASPRNIMAVLSKNSQILPRSHRLLYSFQIHCDTFHYISQMTGQSQQTHKVDPMLSYTDFCQPYLCSQAVAPFLMDNVLNAAGV